MHPREFVRRSLFTSLGLFASGCAADAGAGGDVVIPTPSANASEVASANPTPSSSTRTPVKVPGVGYVTEANGTVHRAGPATCDSKIDLPSCRGTEQMMDCKKDADCKEGPHGKCVSWTGQFRGGDGCGCQYACESDAECGKDQVCACKDVAKTERSQCVEAKCKSDDDCSGAGKSGVCGLSSYFNGCGTEVVLACRTAKDSCQLSSECKDGQSCAVREDVWMCQGISCAIGRPLSVGDAWARADACARADWPLDVGAASVEGEDLARWMEIAALEHASVASFARFSLQLLALGAPAALVRRTGEAAMDEIAHARVAYGIASKLAGRTLRFPSPEPARLGPAELPEARLAIDVDVSSVVRALVLEACVGETIGAIEAFEARDAAACPVLAELLGRIAADEMRHAELAYLCLDWILRAHGDVARHAARRAFADARIPGREADLRDVVEPLGRALVAA